MVESRGTRGPASRLQTREMFALLRRAGRFRDEETAEHVERMSRTCALIARQLGFSPQQSLDLQVASAMHDIGKIGIPDAVLLKPGALSHEERALIERHTEIGYQILSGSGDPIIQLAATVALTHHERVDGHGYPDRLTAEKIPLCGRIAAVADAFDALTHDRVYRPAMPIDTALAIMHQGSGTQFDAPVLQALEAVLPKVLQVGRRYRTRTGEQPGTRYRSGSATTAETGRPRSARSRRPTAPRLSVASEWMHGVRPTA